MIPTHVPGSDSQSNASSDIGARRPMSSVIREESMDERNKEPLDERGRGRLLLIDDEPMVGRAIRRLLSASHDVVIADGGTAALEVLSHDQEFDAIICDLAMPGLDGPAVHERLSERQPSLAEVMVFCTGGAFSASMTTFLSAVRNPVVEKPVRITQLLDAIGNVTRR